MTDNNKNVDGVKKINNEELARSRKLVLDEINKSIERPRVEEKKDGKQTGTAKQVDAVSRKRDISDGVTEKSVGPESGTDKRQLGKLPETEKPLTSLDPVTPPAQSVRVDGLRGKPQPADDETGKEQPKNKAATFEQVQAVKRILAEEETKAFETKREQERIRVETERKAARETAVEGAKATAKDLRRKKEQEVLEGKMAEEKRRREKQRIREEKQKAEADKRAEAERKKKEELKRKQELIKERQRRREEKRKKHEKRKSDRKKKIRTFVVIWKNRYRNSGNWIKRGIRSMVKLLLNLLVFTVVIAAFLYALFALLLIKFDMDNEAFRYLNSRVKVPVIISGVGMLDYYTVKDIRDDVVNRCENIGECTRQVKFEVVRLLTLRNLFSQYNLVLPEDGRINESYEEILNKKIVYDPKVNQVGLNRMDKIKELIDNGGNFVDVASKYGDTLDKIDFSSTEEAVAKFGPEVRDLKIGETSGVVITPEGYYMVRRYDKFGVPLAFSYVFISAKNLDDYLNESVREFKMWSLMDFK